MSCVGSLWITSVDHSEPSELEVLSVGGIRKDVTDPVRTVDQSIPIPFHISVSILKDFRYMGIDRPESTEHESRLLVYNSIVNEELSVGRSQRN